MRIALWWINSYFKKHVALLNVLMFDQYRRNALVLKALIVFSSVLFCLFNVNQLFTYRKSSARDVIWVFSLFYQYLSNHMGESQDFFDKEVLCKIETAYSLQFFI